jgi:hypothetical protein
MCLIPVFLEAFRHLRHDQERLPDHPYRLGTEDAPAAAPRSANAPGTERR